MDTPKISGRRGATIVATVVMVIGLLASGGKFFEDVDASELMVVQSPMSKAQPGAWAPSVQMGGAGQSGGDRAMGLVELLTARTAKDLAIDLTVKAAPKK